MPLTKKARFSAGFFVLRLAVGAVGCELLSACFQGLFSGKSMPLMHRRRLSSRVGGSFP